jgi:lipid-A-disaccharide synthase-like uncharacterized protein
MDSLSNLLWHNGNFLGVHWSAWKVVGWTGNAIFFSRFFVQWYATEKLKRVVVPTSFWWLSLIGTMLLLSYGLFKLRDSVFILGYAFNWIPYLRNLIIHYRHMDAQLECPGCKTECPPHSNFCMACGTRISREPAASTPARA